MCASTLGQTRTSCASSSSSSSVLSQRLVGLSLLSCDLSKAVAPGSRISNSITATNIRVCACACVCVCVYVHACVCKSGGEILHVWLSHQHSRPPFEWRRRRRRRPPKTHPQGCNQHSCLGERKREKEPPENRRRRRRRCRRHLRARAASAYSMYVSIVRRPEGAPNSSSSSPRSTP